jgi:hypothetical protein
LAASGADEGRREESEKIQHEVDRALAVQTIRDAAKKTQPSPYHVKFW